MKHTSGQHAPTFEREHLASGSVTRLTELVTRLVAPNPSPFTFTGTCTYLIGHSRLALIDPGPLNEEHYQQLIKTIGKRSLSHIFVTHTHKDHSPLAQKLKEHFNAMILGCAPHHPARALRVGEYHTLEASNDLDYQPDQILSDGDIVSGDGFTLSAVETPGHTMNHLCFALNEENALFSGDHLMAWSTSIVAPPDGAMSAYMNSLKKLVPRQEKIYWPGHGGPVHDPKRFLRATLRHRQQRERAILQQLSFGPRTIATIVRAIYENLENKLFSAACLSVFAHLEGLIDQNLVVSEGPATLLAQFSLKGPNTSNTMHQS